MNYKLILGLLLVLTLVPLANAQTNKGELINGSNLWITDLDVKVCNPDEGCDTDKDLSDNDNIADEVFPGGTVEFDIEVTNMFPENGSNDIEIDNIEATVTIEGIDDDDDLDEDVEFNDLDAGDRDSVKVKFDIPVEVEEDDFTVVIEIDGDSDNGNQDARLELTLEVKKEDNEVRITNFAITPAEIQCSRVVSVDVAVQNTGSEDEDDVVLEVSSDELGLNIRETIETLSEDPFDDDSKFRKTTKFTVAQNQPAGIYPVEAVVLFDSGRERNSETVEVTVGACQAPVTPVTPPKDEDERDEEEEQEEDDDVVVVRPTPSTPTTQPPVVVTPPTLPPTTEESQPILKSQSFLTALIVGEILLVIIAIVIIAAVMRKRD